MIRSGIDESLKTEYFSFSGGNRSAGGVLARWHLMERRKVLRETEGQPLRDGSRTGKGRNGENAVAAILAAEGYAIVARNFRAGPGEIDIVAFLAPALVFVEVKNWYYFGAMDLDVAIGREKRGRIVETSKIFLSLHRQYKESCVRYDVFLMRGDSVSGRYESAFTGVV